MMDRCPACSSCTYVLADGRRQCRQCRLKFTPRSRQGRLSQEARTIVAQLFWEQISAHQAAGIAGINRKTVQRIYRELREKMAHENDRRQISGNEKEAWSEEGRQLGATNLLCGIGVADGTVWVVFPAAATSFFPDTCCSSLVLGGQWGARDDFLSRVLQRPLPRSSEGDISVAAEFWEFARKHLRRYRVNFRKEFSLYLKEMVFRFNNPEKNSALEFLLRS